ncbi:cytochrome P450 [Mycena vulgaris]|nr:cytochrome P450 [Mycena vulgaris]
MIPSLLSGYPSCASTSIWPLLGFFVIIYGVRWTRNRSKPPLPPRPRKLPLVGNLFDMPSELQWNTYLNWSRELKSDIIHVDAGGTSIVILSSMEAIKDLFERPSRPRLTMLVDLMGRSHRKLFHESLNEGAAKQFYVHERTAAHRLLRQIINDPRNVMKHLRNMAGALILGITYGIDVLPSDDPYIDLVKEAMHGLATASAPGRFMVDAIPALKYVPSWVPGAGFKRKAKQWRKATRDLLNTPESRAQETIIKATAANMYAGGAGTTVAALGTFVLAMLMNPEAQVKAQAELDAVLGHGHLPDFTDEPALPYTSALLKEVLRWRPVTPLGVPHYLSVDDEYQGYRIPAGSVKMYPDPHTFKPERFMLGGKLNPAVMDPETAAFGYGRRICPGKHMAYSSLWITIASILATLDIKKALDKNEKEIEPSHEYFPGLISCPVSFECSLTPRSRQAAENIQATSKAA